MFLFFLSMNLLCFTDHTMSFSRDSFFVLKISDATTETTLEQKEVGSLM